MKKILVLHTGGTISMHADEAGNVRPDTDNPMNHVGVNLENIQVTALDFFNVPSPHITMTALSSLMAQIP
jgi:L-asparaginase